MQFIFLLFCLFLFWQNSFMLAQAAETQLINTSVAISICGNDVIEGGEDCEGDNLAGKTCRSLGFFAGALACEATCTFDLRDCVEFPLIENVEKNASLIEPTFIALAEPVAAATTSPTPSLLPQPTALPAALPETIRRFDELGIGKLLLSDLKKIVSQWIASWRPQQDQSVCPAPDAERNKIAGQDLDRCDINGDDICDLVDLSMLLYHIN